MSAYKPPDSSVSHVERSLHLLREGRLFHESFIKALQVLEAHPDREMLERAIDHMKNAIEEARLSVEYAKVALEVSLKQAGPAGDA